MDDNEFLENTVHHALEPHVDHYLDDHVGWEPRAAAFLTEWVDVRDVGKDAVQFAVSLADGAGWPRPLGNSPALIGVLAANFSRIGWTENSTFRRWGCIYEFALEVVGWVSESGIFPAASRKPSAGLQLFDMDCAVPMITGYSVSASDRSLFSVFASNTLEVTGNREDWLAMDDISKRWVAYREAANSAQSPQSRRAFRLADVLRDSLDQRVEFIGTGKLLGVKLIAGGASAPDFAHPA